MDAQQTNNHEVLEILYDGNCVLCNAEIQYYRNQLRSYLIRFTDISHPAFDARNLGLEPRSVRKHFHAAELQGEKTVFVGVEAFVEIWKVLRIWRPMIGLYSTRIGRVLMDSAYFVFAEVRPYLPKRNQWLNGSSTNCENGQCEI